MRHHQRVGLVVTAVMAGFILNLPSARAHFNEWDSVDDGEIRYEDYTQWDDSRTWAISHWNALNSIDILADSASTIADLEIRDYSASDGLCGVASARTGADLVKLNSSYYGGATVNQRRACTGHEFGHTLGLEHSYVTQLMDSCPVCSNPSAYTWPQSHDIQDYRILWG